jgi:hypothetical protein
MDREQILRRRVYYLIWLFIIGLFLSGATAIPLTTEVRGLANLIGANSSSVPGRWLWLVRDALNDTQMHYPFLFYGTDWLAFGHFMIALAFVGALRDPVRNRWLFDFGLIACAMVVPYALVLGGFRGIPLWWRLIDCSFGFCGAIPLWLCRQWSIELEKIGLDKS